MKHNRQRQFIDFIIIYFLVQSKLQHTPKSGTKQAEFRQFL